MFWYILTTISVLTVAACIIWGVRTYDDAPFYIGVLAGIIAFFLVIIIIVSTVNAKESTNSFVQQKEYLETHEPASEIENATLTSKKLELNGWLYKAQYRQSRYPFFSFYDKDIQNLTPIS